MKNKGFSLVELIVVIAIMAILVGVAVPVYTSYIEKAQKSKDEQMIDEVAHALQVYYTANPVSNPNGFSGYVVLTQKGTEGGSYAEGVEAALEATFGTNWANELSLSYDGWSATFQGSNFYDDEEGLAELMGTVEGLTDSLAAALENDAIANALANGNFAEYAAGMNATSAAAKADAAVFYVADATGNVDAKDLQNAVLSIQTAGNAEAALVSMNGYLNSSLASTAALYALAEGYANYYDANYTTPEGEKSPSDILAETTEGFTNEDGTTSLTTAKDAFTQLMGGFNQMGAVNQAALSEYMTNYMAADINAYAEAMKMVSASKSNILAGNDKTLGDENYFSSTHVSNLVSAYADGSVFVYVIQDSNGQLKVTTSLGE